MISQQQGTSEQNNMAFNQVTELEKHPTIFLHQY